MIEWYKMEWGFLEKNWLYMEEIVKYSVDVVVDCLINLECLINFFLYEKVDVIFFIFSIGFLIFSIEVKVMN